MVVYPGIIALRVHPLVDYHCQAFFGLVKPTYDPEHLIHDRFKLFAVVHVARIYAIIQRQS